MTAAVALSNPRFKTISKEIIKCTLKSKNFILSSLFLNILTWNSITKFNGQLFRMRKTFSSGEKLVGLIRRIIAYHADLLSFHNSWDLIFSKSYEMVVQSDNTSIGY